STPTPPAPPKPDPAKVAAAEAKKAIDAAATALDERDIESAVATLQNAKKIPNVDQASLATIEELLDKANAEKLMHERLEAAEKALEAGRLDEARSLLAGSESTEMFADKHQALSRALDAKLDAEKKQAAAAAAAKAAPKPPERVAEKAPEKPEPPKTAGADTESMQLFEEGKRLLSARQVREAKAALARCVDVNPRFAQCHLLLGAAYAKLNEPDEGARHYEIFLKLAPDAPEAPRVRLMLEQYKGLKK
ncbi:MAG: tetratricopeptide repeat protein, partial [Myxococcaceae bacterium]|nr:tetratricopeptide repeat protein [Myxococcaceae bacterium]